jgi:hypothetical protein
MLKVNTLTAIATVLYEIGLEGNDFGFLKIGRDRDLDPLESLLWLPFESQWASIIEEILS